MLETLKRMLGLQDVNDDSLDEKLLWIIESVRSRLKILLGGIDPLTDLDYIVVEVSIVRFNRIGSEGLQSHSVEGESQNFLNSDFDAYMTDIQAYKETYNADHLKGGILWL